jgi:PAS domain S-box-containing protein
VEPATGRWGTGLFLAGAQRVVDFAFEQMGLHRSKRARRCRTVAAGRIGHRRGRGAAAETLRNRLASAILRVRASRLTELLRTTVLRAGLLAAAYTITGYLGLLVPAFGTNITLVWLPTGIAVAALLRWGSRVWIGVWLGAVAVNLVNGSSLPMALGMGVGNALGPLLAAEVVRRLGLNTAFERLRDILVLGAGAAVGMLVSASVGVLSVTLAGLLPGPKLAAWLLWWAGDVLGVILAAPLVLASNRRELSAILARRAEFLVWAVAIALVLAGVFVVNAGTALAFLPLPIVAWSALRFGAVGTSLGLIVLSFAAAYGTSFGYGPFGRESAVDAAVLLWLYLATAAVLGWLIAGVHTARLKATDVQQLFERALSDASLGVVLGDRGGRLTYANSGMTRLTGYDASELVGQPLSMLRAPDTDPDKLAELETTLDGPRRFDGDLRFRRKDGTSHWAAVLVSPASDRREGGGGFLAILRSADARKAAQAALEDSRTRLDTLIQHVPGMAYRCANDEAWTMMIVSPGCEALTGYRRDELEGNRVVAYGDLVHLDDREWLWAKCQVNLDAHLVCQNEYRIFDRSGRERWVSEHASGAYDDNERLLHIDGFIQDISAAREARLEREQLERKMLEAQKLEGLGVLAGGFAHDFNNILTSILGHASLGLMKVAPSAPEADHFQRIADSSQRAADLCRQLLAYSGKSRFVIQRLDLSELVRATTQMLQLSISKSAVLRLQLSEGLPPVSADATQVRQVVMNLVINASEAVHETGGVISVSTGLMQADRAFLAGAVAGSDVAGDYVFVEVADTGVGMDQDTQARIFDPFFTTKFTGRGLGLAAVLGIVRGHHGALSLNSAPGRGAAFRVLLPVADGAIEAARGESSGDTGWRGTGTLLVVDDEEEVRSTVVRMAHRLGFQTEVACDGREAVDVFGQNPDRFSVVLLDLTMPRMNGVEVLTEMTRLQPNVRAVLMSGYSERDAQARLPDKKGIGFLQKPFSMDTLRAVLRTAREA